MVAETHFRQPGADESPDLKLGAPVARAVRPASFERRDRLVVVARLVQRLRAGERTLEPAVLLGRNATRQEACIDAEPRGEPLDRLARRPRLAALDLGEVLLREPVARELALRQTCGGREARRSRSPRRALGPAGDAVRLAVSLMAVIGALQLVKRILH